MSGRWTRGRESKGGKRNTVVPFQRETVAQQRCLSIGALHFFPHWKREATSELQVFLPGAYHDVRCHESCVHQPSASYSYTSCGYPVYILSTFRSVSCWPLNPCWKRSRATYTWTRRGSVPVSVYRENMLNRVNACEWRRGPCTV